MKNLKKVLAMVLAFACTFSMFAGAKVFEDVPAGSDYSEAVTMLSDLGVIQGKDDGKYHPEDTITRAEACAMIARLMTGDPNVSQYVGAQSFTDVAKGSWKDSAIGYCYINGIVIGVGNNKFEPDRAITDAEFITMVVRAMGYETADMKQNYPYSYMSNAQAIGLLDGTNMVASTDALRGEDAQVIYNALFTDYARGAKLVNTTHGTSVEQYPVLAEQVWGLTRAAVGTWNEKDDEDATLKYCKAHTWVVLGADPTAEGHILAYAIEDDSTDLYTDNKDKLVYSFKYDGDASSVAGYQVELWGEGSHGEPEWESKNDKYVWSDNWEIKAIKTVKGQKAYDYNASMADKKDDNGEIVLGEETLKLESVADNANVAQKEQAVDQYLYKGYHGETKLDKKKVEKALNVRDGAQYKLVDWDSDGDVDWVVVSTANYYKVENANSKRVTVVSMSTKGDFETSTDSTKETWELDGLTDTDNSKIKYNYKAEDLKEGDIVEVTYTVAYDKSEKAQVVTANVSKVEAETKSLDKVSTKGGLELTFDDEVIKVAQNVEAGDTIVPANPRTYREFNGEELGTEFALYMNRNGFIVYSDYATETANYAMVLDVADGKDKAGDRKLAKVDLLLADNSVKKDVEVTSSARVQYANGDDNTDAYDKRDFDDQLVVGNVYKYWTNEDGQITKMQAMFSTDDTKADGKYDLTDYTYKSSTDRLQDAKGAYVASLEEADVIFAVKSENYVDSTDADDMSVDAKNVMAVKYDQIPDINLDDEDTDAVELDKTDDGSNGDWLNNRTAKFVVTANGNKAGTAALLGVDSFNKFNAGATKLGLVTNVSYVNSSDGRYVEADIAVNGKVETFKSANKVDFGDIVEVQGFGDVKSESTKVHNGVFHGTRGDEEIALDKYLEDNAAYAEITTDADGKLTEISFLNTKASDANVLVGDYYTVERRVMGEKTKDKSFDYVDTTARYAAEKKLYSVDRMPIENAGIADEVAYYMIDGRPTRMDGSYDDEQLMLVSAGFDGTPDIEVSDKASMMYSDIDLENDSDSYAVADVAFNADGDIVAMFAFDEYMTEVDDINGALVTEKTDRVVNPGAAAKTIADVDTLEKNAKVSDVTIKLDNKEVTNVKGALVGTKGNYTLGITADADAKISDKYTAEFTVGTGKDARTYFVKFEVKAADVVVPTSDAKVEKAGIAKVDEQDAVTKITFKGTTVNEATKFAVELNGEKITVDMRANQNGPRYAATALADAITDKLIKGITATASEMSVTVTGEGTDVAVDFIPGNSKLTADIVTEQEYVAPVAAQKGKATLTITSGVDAETELALAVDGNEFNAVTIPAKASADEVAKALAEAASTSTRFDVTYKDNVITVEQKAGYNFTKDFKMDLTIVNKA